MPRSFSSRSRSGSIPVNECTKTDFPWSTCPAVPSTNIYQPLYNCPMLATLKVVCQISDCLEHKLVFFRQYRTRVKE